MLIILPYKNGSKSVNAVKDSIVSLELRTEGSRFKGNAKKKVVNWGCSTPQPEVAKCQVLNNFANVAIAANKLETFNVLADGNDIHIPRFTTSILAAEHWLATEDIEIVERHTLTGHSGKGIRIVTKNDMLQKAPLYVVYVPKTQEYRVHVFQGKVIDIQRKARKKDVADGDVNWKVRNLDNGFIYARDFAPEDLPRDLEEQAVLATAKLGLDFGAVDLIYNKRSNRTYVLEINTAPGLQGTTLEAYVQAFKDAGWDNPV